MDSSHSKQEVIEEMKPSPKVKFSNKNQRMLVVQQGELVPVLSENKLANSYDFKPYIHQKSMPEKTVFGYVLMLVPQGSDLHKYIKNDFSKTNKSREDVKSTNYLQDRLITHRLMVLPDIKPDNEHSNKKKIKTVESVVANFNTFKSNYLNTPFSELKFFCKKKSEAHNERELCLYVVAENRPPNATEWCRFALYFISTCLEQHLIIERGAFRPHANTFTLYPLVTNRFIEIGHDFKSLSLMDCRVLSPQEYKNLSQNPSQKNKKNAIEAIVLSQASFDQFVIATFQELSKQARKTEDPTKRARISQRDIHDHYVKTLSLVCRLLHESSGHITSITKYWGHVMDSCTGRILPVPFILAWLLKQINEVENKLTNLLGLLNSTKVHQVYFLELSTKIIGAIQMQLALIASLHESVKKVQEKVLEVSMPSRRPNLLTSPRPNDPPQNQSTNPEKKGN